MKLRHWPETLLVTLGVYAVFSTFTVALSKSKNENHKVDYSRTPVEHGDIEKKNFTATNLDLEKPANKDRKVQYDNTLVLNGEHVTEGSLSRTYTIYHAAWIFPTSIISTGGAALLGLALSTFCWLG